MLEAARKGLIKSIGVPVAKLLEFIGVNTKELYEFTYWRVRKIREKVLDNSHYEPLFTTWVGLDRKFYSGKSVLDIGCGPRGSLEWLDDAKQRVGLDSLVESYRKLGIDKHKMEYVHAGAESTPFSDSHFDIITTFNSLDHVEDPDAVLNEIHRILSLGGTFVIVVEIHAKPTIAEPHVLSWDFLDNYHSKFKFDFIKKYKFNPEHAGAIAALQSKLPIDQNAEDGVVFAIATKIVEN